MTPWCCLILKRTRAIHVTKPSTSGAMARLFFCLRIDVMLVIAKLLLVAADVDAEPQLYLDSYRSPVPSPSVAPSCDQIITYNSFPYEGVPPMKL